MSPQLGEWYQLKTFANWNKAATKRISLGSLAARLPGFLRSADSLFGSQTLVGLR
jgi:hypothetical protein